MYKTSFIEAKSWSIPFTDRVIPDIDLAPDERSRKINELEHPWHSIRLRWTWPVNPTDPPWSHFRIVRSPRSPAMRVEEGRTLVEGRFGVWNQFDHEGVMVYLDMEPPPGEWTFYRFFFLTKERIWVGGSFAMDMCPDDHDWTLRLPELLPGVVISDNLGTAEPASDSNTLVQFLQGPATYLDRAVSIIHSISTPWDPLRVPPQAVEHLSASLGYPDTSGTIGLARQRELLNAITKPVQGSLDAINGIAIAASGCVSQSNISNNLMLSVNDSSFESGNIYDTGWWPVYTDPNDEGTKLDVREITEIVLPPNVLAGYFLYIPTGRRIACEAVRVVDQLGVPTIGNDGRPASVVDPIRAGIPISTWTKVRMGCYAANGGPDVPLPPTAPNDLSMGLDIYDNNGLFVRSIEVLQPRPLTGTWKWHGNGDGQYMSDGEISDPYVDILDEPVQLLGPDILDMPDRWSGEGGDYEGPQTGIASELEPNSQGGKAIAITWNPAATGVLGRAAVTTQVTGLAVGARYTFRIEVHGTAGSADWSPVILWSGGKVVSDSFDFVEEDTVPMELVWTAEADTVRFGIEVSEGAGWDQAGKHRIVHVEAVRANSSPAYGVPWLQVGDASSVDLIVVDDG